MVRIVVGVALVVAAVSSASINIALEEDLGLLDAPLPSPRIHINSSIGEDDDYYYADIQPRDPSAVIHILISLLHTLSPTEVEDTMAFINTIKDTSRHRTTEWDRIALRLCH